MKIDDLEIPRQLEPPDEVEGIFPQTLKKIYLNLIFFRKF